MAGRQSADLPRAYVRHLTSTRARLKIPERRHDAAFFAAVRDALQDWTSVRSVEVNPTTASVLLHFDDPMALWLEQGTKNTLFTVEQAKGALPEPVALDVRRRAQRLDAMLGGLSDGAVDLRSLTFLVFAAAGLVQLLRGNIAAPAATLLWYAAESLRADAADRTRRITPAPGD